MVNPPPGYPSQGYPDQGYPDQGYPDQGYPSQGYPSQGYPDQGYPDQGYPGQGYPGQGYPGQGYPGQGYPPPGYPPPGYPGQGYPPPGYPPPGYPGQGYPPPGYPPPGYPGQAYPTGYPGYPPPPGYGTPRYSPPVVKPGIIPLRPLSLSDIYNGAVGYIRANPKVTLGLTAIVVVLTWIISLVTQVFPRAAVNRLIEDPPSYEPSGRDMAVWGTSMLTGAALTALCTIVLIGMLTVVVGRAVFGSPITLGEAWALVRGRFLALIGFAVLAGLGSAMLIGMVGTVAAIVFAKPGTAPIGVPLVLALAGLFVYLSTAVSLAATVIVLERQPVLAAIGRSFALVRNGFWRVLGILLLTGLVTYLVTGAVALPFTLAGMLLGGGAGSPAAGVISGVGTSIGQIIALPFTAGVVTLLYTDRRIRAEAFDLVLQTGAAGALPPAASTDSLWLIRPPG